MPAVTGCGDKSSPSSPFPSNLLSSSLSFFSTSVAAKLSFGTTKESLIDAKRPDPEEDEDDVFLVFCEPFFVSSYALYISGRCAERNCIKSATIFSLSLKNAEELSSESVKFGLFGT